MAKRKIVKNKLLFIIIGVCVGLMIPIIYYKALWLTLRLRGSINTNSEQRQSNRQEALKKAGHCNYENPPRESFLETYIVKKGDTLLSITKALLGSVSRVNELIAMNRKQFPHLSMANTYIEVGWKLFITPKSYGETSGKVNGYSGLIIDINTEMVELRNYESQASYGFHYFKYGTVYEGKDKFEIGDCVNIITDTGTHRIIKISLQ